MPQKAAGGKRDRGADACVLTWCGGGTYLHVRAAHAVLYGSDQIVMTTYGCDLPFFTGAAAPTAVSVFHDLRLAAFVFTPVTDSLPHYCGYRAGRDADLHSYIARQNGADSA